MRGTIFFLISLHINENHKSFQNGLQKCQFWKNPQFVFQKWHFMGCLLQKLRDQGPQKNFGGSHLGHAYHSKSKWECFNRLKSHIYIWYIKLHIQWKPLNVITDNVIIRLMWSIWPGPKPLVVNNSLIVIRGDQKVG